MQNFRNFVNLVNVGVITRTELAAAACAAAAAALLALARRRVARRLDEVLDPRSATFASRAQALLFQQGFARIRFAPADATLSQELLSDADRFFQDGTARRYAHIPPKERRCIDSRSGYVSQHGREFLELHPRVPSTPESASSPSAAALLRSATAFSAACHELCECVAAELARGCPALQVVLRAEREAVEAVGSGVRAGCAPPAACGTFSASMLRVHTYTEDADYPAHVDLGLITLAPRGSVPGLAVQLRSGAWLAVEERMAADEAILFGGSTLAALHGGLPALPHKVVRQGTSRLSAPYFLRASPHVTLPASEATAVAAAAAIPAVASNGAPAVTAGAEAAVAPAAAAAPPQTVGAFVAQISEGRMKAHAMAAAQQQQQQQLPQPPLPPPPAQPAIAVAVPTAAAVAIAMPVVDGSLPVAVAAPVATPVDEAATANRGGAPARVRGCFAAADADEDGRLVLAEVCAALEAEFRSVGWPAHARDAVPALFEALAIGDLSFAQPYLDGRRFNVLFAEALFARFCDAEAGATHLDHDGAQSALKFLVRPPKDGAPKPDVPFACPAGAYDQATGQLRLPLEWFLSLYRTMP